MRSYELLRLAVSVGFLLLALWRVAGRRRVGGSRSWYRGVYLRSGHWRRFRSRWWSRHPGAVCAVCGGSGPMDLHHVTYRRLGRERSGDVRPVHRACHDGVHGR
jgi:hypothetical protein